MRFECSVVDPNGTDGIFGGGTEAAVKKYQKRSQLAESGVVDTALWGRLSAEIKPLQEALRTRYSCRADGVADTACYQAVLDFQRKHALSADGMSEEEQKRCYLAMRMQGEL